MTPFKIIFMGTPQFACPSLRTLLASPHQIAAVVTQPDRPRGRGRKVIAPPVKKMGLENNCIVLQPDSIKTPQIIAQLTEFKADFLVVVAYGQILPQALLDMPPFGAINVHASLLPCCRGPAPIQWAILNQESSTGVTTMQMDAGLDTGNILMQAGTPIEPTDTAQDLHDRLSELGANLLLKTLEMTQDGPLQSRPQNHAEATYAPLLKKSDGHIDWNKPANYIDAQVRAFTPWPGAYCFWETSRLKVLGAVALPDDPTQMAPGTVIQGFDNELRIAASEGAVSITRIQNASGKRLSIDAFLRGCPIPLGARLT